MDTETKKENDDQEPKYTTEKFMEVYKQLNTENKRKVEQMIIKGYMEQVSEDKD